MCYVYFETKSLPPPLPPPQSSISPSKNILVGPDFKKLFHGPLIAIAKKDGEIERCGGSSTANSQTLMTNSRVHLSTSWVPKSFPNISYQKRAGCQCGTWTIWLGMLKCFEAADGPSHIPRKLFSFYQCYV